jgi:outer membrane protein TolC
MTRIANSSPLWIALVSLFLFPSLALSDDEALKAQYPPSSTLLKGLEAHVSLRPISLSEAIALGLQNNLDVQVQRYSPMIADLTAEQAWGAYDPTIGSEYGYRDSTQPIVDGGSADRLAGSGTKQQDGIVTIGGMVPYVGAMVNVDVEGSNIETDSFITALNPGWDSKVTVSTSIPILRGLIWNEAWTSIKATDKLSDAADEGFRSDVMDTVQGIEVAYWNLVASAEQLRVARKSLETANATLSQTETQYEVGVVSKVEVVEAEAGVADRDFRLIVAENQFQTAQDVFADLILGRNLHGVSNLAFHPTDEPNADAPEALDVPDALTVAFEKRPELREAEAQIERQELRLRFAKNQRLPQLDFVGSYAAAGQTGTTKEFTDEGGTVNPPVVVGSGVGDAFRNLASDDGGDTYVARAVFSIPFPNTRARKAVSISELELRRANTLLKRLEQGIILDIRRTLRGVESSYRGIHAADRRVAAAAEQLRAEEIRLEHGESTPFDVLLRERDLVDAESQFITALQAYQSSAVFFERARGTILDGHSIVIDDVRPLR